MSVRPVGMYSGVGFYGSLHATLKVAVTERNITTKEVYEHFLRCVPEGRTIVDAKAIVDASRKLDIPCTLKDAADLLRGLKRNPAEGLTLRDINRIVCTPTPKIAAELASVNISATSNTDLPSAASIDTSQIGTSVLEEVENAEKKLAERDAKAAVVEVSRDISHVNSWKHDKAEDLIDIKLPVKHVMMVKKIEENSDGELFLYATLIQHIVGVCPKDADGELLSFPYRFNEMKPEDEFLCKRRSRTTVNDGLSGTYSTFSAKIQLDKKAIYSRYPFMIFECSANIEMSTFAHENIQFRPNMVFHPDTLSKGQVYQFLSVRDPFEEIFDGSVNFDFVTPYPSVKVTCDGKSGGYCPKFQVSFFCTEPLLFKLINFYLPLALVIVLNWLHVLAPQDTSDYISNTSGIALTLVFLLPLMYPATSYQIKFGLNEYGVAAMFLAMIVSLIKTPMNLNAYEETLTGEMEGFLQNANMDEIFRVSRDVDPWVWFKTHWVPNLTIILSCFFLVIPFFNYWMYIVARNDILKRNGSFDGKCGITVSEKNFKKNRKLRREKGGGRNKDVESLNKDDSFRLNLKLPPKKSKRGEVKVEISSFRTCFGWSSGFKKSELEKPGFIWRK